MHASWTCVRLTSGCLWRVQSQPLSEEYACALIGSALVAQQVQGRISLNWHIHGRNSLDEGCLLQFFKPSPATRTRSDLTRNQRRGLLSCWSHGFSTEESKDIDTRACCLLTGNLWRSPDGDSTECSTKIHWLLSFCTRTSGENQVQRINSLQRGVLGSQAQCINASPTEMRGRMDL